MAKRLKLTLTKMQVQSLAIYASTQVSSARETERVLWRAIEREARNALAYNDRAVVKTSAEKDAD